jgi:hypothetical protein
MKRALCLAALCWHAASHAHADVERFAVIVGNNRGAADEEPLRYAEADAARLYDVLLQLGDVSPLNGVLLRGRDATFVRGALLAINARIRDAATKPDTQVVLIIYYSGHADAQALHLQGSELPLSELRQLAHGSAAKFRLVVLDACRSGALTRVKGGQRVAPFALPPSAQAPLPGDGVAFLTASSAHEDAQESDELQGSFFTHAFVTGLLGAADADGDGAVVLDEAYRYAYGTTLRASSRTSAGTQHPTFEYDLRGRGELVLTRPAAYASARASVAFPAALSFMLMRDSSAGAVVLELEASHEVRTLSVEPGHYFVRARGPEVMYEGTLEAASGSSRAIDVSDMARIDYARLVRKGARASAWAHGPLVGASVRSQLPNASTACMGPFVGYSFDVSQFGVRARASACASELENHVLTASLRAYDVQVDLYHAWEVARLTLEVGLSAGGSLFDQRFRTRGRAPSRLSAAPFIAPGVAARLDLSFGFYADLHIAAETHFLRVTGNEPSSHFRVAFAVRSGLGIGRYF